jgi:hypothetical protein
MYRLVNCSHCQQQYPVDAMQLARGLSRLVCPSCHAITGFAERQIQSPTTSPEAKQFWAVVGGVALVIGLLRFLDRLDGWA